MAYLRSLKELTELIEEYHTEHIVEQIALQSMLDNPQDLRGVSPLGSVESEEEKGEAPKKKKKRGKRKKKEKAQTQVEKVASGGLEMGYRYQNVVTKEIEMKAGVKCWQSRTDVFEKYVTLIFSSYKPIVVNGIRI